MDGLDGLEVVMIDADDGRDRLSLLNVYLVNQSIIMGI